MNHQEMNRDLKRDIQELKAALKTKDQELKEALKEIQLTSKTDNSHAKEISSLNQTILELKR